MVSESNYNHAWSFTPGVSIFVACTSESEIDTLFDKIVENEGQVKFRPVTTGFQDGWRILIARGIHPDENVVVVGHGLIEDGEKVKVTRTVLSMEELVQ